MQTLILSLILSFLIAAPAAAQPLTLIGASNTYGEADPMYAPGWSETLAGWLGRAHRRWSDPNGCFNECNEVCNVGVPGATTDTWQNLLAFLNPDFTGQVVVLELGTNDARPNQTGAPFEPFEFEDKLERVVGGILGRGAIEVILVTPPLVHKNLTQAEGLDPNEVNARLHRYGNRVLKTCRAGSPFGGGLIRGENDPNTNVYCGPDLQIALKVNKDISKTDAIHYTVRGHRRVAELLWSSPRIQNLTCE